MVENTLQLKCPICSSDTNIQKLGQDVCMLGQTPDGAKQFASSPMKIFRCGNCGFFMFFDQDIKTYKLKTVESGV